MEQEILFRERQRFTQWWLWAVIVVSMAGPIAIIIELMKEGRTDKAMLAPLIILPAVIVLLMICRLETVIKKDGIYVRFFPFHLKERFFPWDKLAKSYVRKYSPIGEFGGWGLRGITRRKRAWNVSGNIGIQLEMQDGARLLIGTNKAEEAKEVLKRLGHLTE